jgi:hypothetical protein
MSIIRKHPITRGPSLLSYNKEDILVYLRELAVFLGKNTLSSQDINRAGQINAVTIHNKFGSQSKALIEAGLKPSKIYKRDRKRMIDELAKLIYRFGREPKKSEMLKYLSHNHRHYELEFGSIKHAFKEARQNINLSLGKNINLSPVEKNKKLHNNKRIRRKYGEVIQFKNLRHAPTNKLGVVFLFGMLSEHLGIEVESIQSGFPDCDGKRLLPDGAFERIRIVIEFRSTEFYYHKHNPNRCDVLLCWEDDWSKGSHEIEVIELKSFIKSLSFKH